MLVKAHSRRRKGTRDTLETQLPIPTPEKNGPFTCVFRNSSQHAPKRRRVFFEKRPYFRRRKKERLLRKGSLFRERYARPTQTRGCGTKKGASVRRTWGTVEGRGVGVRVRRPIPDDLPFSHSKGFQERFRTVESSKDMERECPSRCPKPFDSLIRPLSLCPTKKKCSPWTLAVTGRSTRCRAPTTQPFLLSSERKAPLENVRIPKGFSTGTLQYAQSTLSQTPTLSLSLRTPFRRLAQSKLLRRRKGASAGSSEPRARAAALSPTPGTDSAKGYVSEEVPFGGEFPTSPRKGLQYGGIYISGTIRTPSKRAPRSLPSPRPALFQKTETALFSTRIPASWRRCEPRHDLLQDGLRWSTEEKVETPIQRGTNTARRATNARRRDL